MQFSHILYVERCDKNFRALLFHMLSDIRFLFVCLIIKQDATYTVTRTHFILREYAQKEGQSQVSIELKTLRSQVRRVNAIHRM